LNKRENNNKTKSITKTPIDYFIFQKIRKPIEQRENYYDFDV